MPLTLALAFLGGAFAANGVPHFVKGIMRETYPCLLGDGPVPNLVAGWAAFVVSALLLRGVHVDSLADPSVIAGALGVLLTGLFHAWGGAFWLRRTTS